MTNYQIPQTALLKYKGSATQRKGGCPWGAGWEIDWFLAPPGSSISSCWATNAAPLRRKSGTSMWRRWSKIYLSYYRSYLGRLMKVQVGPVEGEVLWAPELGGGTV